MGQADPAQNLEASLVIPPCSWGLAGAEVVRAAVLGLIGNDSSLGAAVYFVQYKTEDAALALL